MKSHQYFDPRFERVIYIVRDPRDVAVSQYHFFRKRRRIGDEHTIQQFVTSFVAGKTSDYGSWKQNVSSWLATRYGSPGFLLLRYEDILSDTPRELARVAQFLDITTSPTSLAQAVERSSAQQMRMLEAKHNNNPLTKDTRKDIPFVRSAIAGGWKSSLPPDSVTEIESGWAPLMIWLGYELSIARRTPVQDFPAEIFGEVRR